MSSLEHEVRALREAGNVARCHTIPSSPYSVGHHSWGALTLLLLLAPAPSVGLVKVVAWHDAPERWAGDLPAPARWGSAELDATYAAVEERITARAFPALAEALRLLSEDDLRWLRLVDSLDFILWAREEMYRGNRHVERAHELAMARFIERAMPNLPAMSSEAREALTELLYGPTIRLPEVTP